MEDRENLNTQNVVHNVQNVSILNPLQSPTFIGPRKRLIKRYKKPKTLTKNTNKVRQRKNRKYQPRTINNYLNCKNKSQCEIEQKITQLPKADSSPQQLRPSRRKIQKIYFNINELPEHIQSLYAKCQKLKNTDLIIPGVKFVHQLTFSSISRWEKALIIYQQKYKKNQRFHFGLLLKNKQRLISFDGIAKLWPIKDAQKSYHWVAQEDTWSCGYQVLFWVKKIQERGIDSWINQMQFRRSNSIFQKQQEQ